MSDVLPAARAALGQGLNGVPGCGLELEPSKTACWRLAGGRPWHLPAGVLWKPLDFVVLGAACDGAREFMDAGLAMPTAHATHWTKVMDACRASLNRVHLLYQRRSQIGLAQGEAILNAAQCAQLLQRYCVEPKMLNLLRTTPPRNLGNRAADADTELQTAMASLAGLCFLTPTAARQMGLPIREGGCGVGGLQQRGHAAYLGSWALCL